MGAAPVGQQYNCTLCPWWSVVVSVVYLSWIVEEPLLSGFLLVGCHGLSHLMSDRGSHGVQ